MKKRKATVKDLHYDALKEILLCVARSSDGAKNLANTFSVCKAFQQFVEDADVLRAVTFDNLLISGNWDLFQLTEGLINRCAQAGNSEAQFILAKIIMVSASQLVRVAEAASDEQGATRNYSSFYGRDLTPYNILPKEPAKVLTFLENFLPERNYPHTTGSHSDLMRHFFSRATYGDWEDMPYYLRDCFKYFLGCKSESVEQADNITSFTRSALTFYLMEYVAQEFVEKNRDLCLRACEYMNILGLNKEQPFVIEENVEEREYHGCGKPQFITLPNLVEKLDMLINRFSAIQTVEGKIIQNRQRLAGRAKSFQLDASDVNGLFTQVSFYKKRTEQYKSMLPYFRDMRAKVFSAFDVLAHQFVKKPA